MIPLAAAPPGEPYTITGLGPEVETLLLLLDNDEPTAYVLSRRMYKCGWRQDSKSLASVLVGLRQMGLVASTPRPGGFVYRLTMLGEQWVERIRNGKEIVKCP